MKTAVFEGPLQVLVQLAEGRHIEITKVSIAGIVGDYLQRLRERGPDLETTSGFVLMAAVLIHLKAGYLLPDPAPVDVEEELALLDERDRLFARMLAFPTFRDMAAVLGHRLGRAGRYVGRSAGIDRRLPGPEAPLLPEGVTSGGLAALVEGLAQVGTPRPDIDHLDLDLPSVGDAMEEIRVRIVAEMESTFETLVAHCTDRVEVAAYFLAVLEPARWGVVSVARDEPSEISVRYSSGAEAAPAGARRVMPGADG